MTLMWIWMKTMVDKVVSAVAITKHAEKQPLKITIKPWWFWFSIVQCYLKLWVRLVLVEVHIFWQLLVPRLIDLVFLRFFNQRGVFISSALIVFLQPYQKKAHSHAKKHMRMFFYIFTYIKILSLNELRLNEI